MNTRMRSAPKASKTINHMLQILGTPNTWPRWRGGLALLAAALLLGTLAGCATPGGEAAIPGTVEPTAPMPQAPAPAGAATPPAQTQIPKARWQAVAWADLPGWNADRVAEALPALLQSCTRLVNATATPAWRQACTELAALREPNDAALRFWLESRFVPFRVEAPDGNANGLLTGYYEPLLEASRQRRPGFEVPLYRAPADLQSRRPWFTRQEIESPNSAAQAALRGREIAYLADPVDALVLHIQGSGRINVREPDGTVRIVRVAFGGHNDQPYRSVGRWLIDQRELTAAQASWPGIKAWIERTRPSNPQRVQEMFFTNPRYVFFREEPAPVADDSLTPTGPRGAQGVPLLAGRSVAVDRDAVPYGTPLWLDSTDATGSVNAGRPIQRLVMAQDTGSAILGAVRADYFWGFGSTSSEVADQAGRTRQPLRYWALWPR